ncbi:MAG TPA: hypothetical protein DCO75_04135 [Fibrobacteres bacterium]|jgi:hypothetical protein|nr:hypothetical protein [Fibrobacterota bacterium]
MRNKFILLSILIVANVANAALSSDSIQNSTINKLHQRSLILIAKYNLNPTNKTPFYKELKVDFPLPMDESFILDTVDSNPQSHSKLGFTLLQDASKSIGLNPALYIGKRIFRLNYLLNDSTQSNEIITAHVLFSDTNLVGAHLRLEGYAPGIVALNNHSQFKPKNFIFPIFNPDLLDTVSILGPWDKSDNGCNWINRVNLLSKEETSYFTNTFSAAKKVNADLHYWLKSLGEEYAAAIKFKTGERYFPHFIFRNDTVYLNDYKCYYILDRKFIDFVTEIIKSKGISTCQETQQRREDYRNRKNLRKLGTRPAQGE